MIGYKTMLKVLDLFSGTGTFVRAFFKEGFQISLSSDYNSDSKVFHETIPIQGEGEKIPFFLGDIKDLSFKDIPKHDVLCGGFPCQPFSIAGKMKGFRDERSYSLFALFDIIEEKKPRYLVLENVKNILSHDKGRSFQIILKILDDIGYEVVYKILDTCQITGIPQHRESVYSWSSSRAGF